MLNIINSNYNVNSYNYRNNLPNKSKYSSNKILSFTGNPEKAAQVGTDALLELAKKLSSALQEGKNKLVTDVMSLVQAGEIRKAIGEMNKNMPPEGFIKETAEHVELSTFNWDGTPITHIFKKVPGFKNLGVADNATNETAENVLLNAFSHKPKATIGAVGWTVIKSENVKGGVILTKVELSKAYEDGFKEFFEPVYEYINKGLGINKKDIGFASCVNNTGIDKALMNISEEKQSPVVTVTPFCYGIYGREEHPFPTVFTQDIPGYVDLYSKLANTIVLTGGRDHAFRYDAGVKWLAQNEGLVIPVDILKDFKGIEVPAKVNGKIENAAALAYETFENPFPPHLIEEFQKMPTNEFKDKLKHPAQQALAAAIYRQVK